MSAAQPMSVPHPPSFRPRAQATLPWVCALPLLLAAGSHKSLNALQRRLLSTLTKLPQSIRSILSCLNSLLLLLIILSNSLLITLLLQSS